MDNFGRLVRETRKQLKITAEELALKVGVDRTYISKIENHFLLPSPELLDKISRFINLPPVAIAAYFKEKYPKFNITLTPSKNIELALGDIHKIERSIQKSNAEAKDIDNYLSSRKSHKK